MANDRRLPLRRLLFLRLTLGVARLAERGGRRSSIGDASDVDESRFDSHDWPLVSRDDSVSARPVWINHDDDDDDEGICSRVMDLLIFIEVPL